MLKGGPPAQRAEVGSPDSCPVFSAHAYVTLGSDNSEDGRHNPPIEDLFEAAQIQNLRARGRQKTWHTRPKSPGIRWNRHYDERQEKLGRVFVVDFVRGDLSREGMRKVAAQEISRPAGLEELFADPKRQDDSVLRLFHVQNAKWATEILLKKFFPSYDDFGRDFGKYVSYRWPELRGGKSVLRGKCWPTQHEPKRSLIKTAFGLDYLKLYKVLDPLMMAGRDRKGKLMELNCFDEENTHPFVVTKCSVNARAAMSSNEKLYQKA